MAEPQPDDPLEQLRERVRAAQQAAERLTRHPPRGYATTGDHASRASQDLQDLAALLETLRSLVPAELQAQITDLIRQVLLLVRALIDRWVDRIDAEHGRDPVVEDIPVR